MGVVGSAYAGNVIDPAVLSFCRCLFATTHVMRVFIVLFLSCMAVSAAEIGVRVTTNLSTNAETGAVSLEETFTRDGQTNLVRQTTMEDSVVASRIQRFYQGGEFVAVHLLVTRPAHMARTSFTTMESSYSVSLDFTPSKDIERVIITRKKGNILDGFTATNGVFYPVSNAELKIRAVK